MVLLSRQKYSHQNTLQVIKLNLFKISNCIYQNLCIFGPNLSYFSRISIVNLTKPDSLYKEGMRPLMYSTADAANNIGWRRCGENIAYFRNDEPTTYTKNYHQGNYFGILRKLFANCFCI